MSPTSVGESSASQRNSQPITITNTANGRHGDPWRNTRGVVASPLPFFLFPPLLPSSSPLPRPPGHRWLATVPPCLAPLALILLDPRGWSSAPPPRPLLHRLALHRARLVLFHLCRFPSPFDLLRLRGISPSGAEPVRPSLRL